MEWLYGVMELCVCIEYTFKYGELVEAKHACKHAIVAIPLCAPAPIFLIVRAVVIVEIPHVLQPPLCCDGGEVANTIHPASHIPSSHILTLEF